MPSKGKVACLLAEEFEDTEFHEPVTRLRNAGFEVVVIGIREAGDKLRGKHRLKVRTDRSIDQVLPQDYIALLIPGGHSPDALRADDRIVSFVRMFDQLKRPIYAICHGPQLLLSAGLVNGRTLTSWETVRKDLQLAGAHVKNEPLVIDDNWYTSRNPEDAEKFSWVFVDRLLADHGEDEMRTGPVGADLFNPPEAYR